MKKKPTKIKSPYLLGLFFGIAFMTLLGIRLDIISLTKSPEKQGIINVSEKESWMGIYRHDQKIGYSHRSLEKTGSGYRLLDKTHLRLNVMGMVQDMRIRTKGNLNDDFLSFFILI